MQPPARRRGQPAQDLGLLIGACRDSRRRSAGSLGGYRLFSIVVLRRPARRHRAYWYADRVVARDGRRARARSRPRRRRCTRRSSGSQRGPASPTPRLYLIRDGHPRVLSAGRGRQAATRSSSAAGSGRGPAGGARRRDRARDRAHPHAATSSCRRSPPWSARRCSRSAASGGWFQRGAAVRARPDRVGDRARCCSRPGASSTADAGAAELCESPHGLADALLRLEQANELVAFAGNPALEPLYVVNPFEEQGLAALFSDAPADGGARQPTPCAGSGVEATGSRPRRSTKKGPKRALLRKIRRRPTLPGGCPPSTIGAGGLNFSVRNGKRCTPAAMTAETCQVRADEAHPQNSIVAFGVFKIKTSGN